MTKKQVFFLVAERRSTVAGFIGLRKAGLSPGALGEYYYCQKIMFVGPNSLYCDKFVILACCLGIGPRLSIFPRVLKEILMMWRKYEVVYHVTPPCSPHVSSWSKQLLYYIRRFWSRNTPKGCVAITFNIHSHLSNAELPVLENV